MNLFCSTRTSLSASRNKPRESLNVLGTTANLIQLNRLIPLIAVIAMSSNVLANSHVTDTVVNASVLIHKSETWFQRMMMHQADGGS